MTPELRFDAAMLDIEERAPVDRLGLAVSGGGDSLALLFLAAEWAARHGAELHVATVDHGLRPESAGEAALVASLAQAAGAAHVTLCWRGWDGQGNLQAEARRARKRLIGDWAKDRGVATVMTGHTEDDQAETVLMRLARGSGVDGLGGMRRVSIEGGLIWARPLLGHRRAELRDWLCDRGATWVEDPSNEDDRFDRVKARRLLSSLGELGLTVARLSATAERMQAAADALDATAGALAKRIVRVDRGDLVIERADFLGAPADIRARLMAAGLRFVSGNPYRPRFDALTGLLRDCAEGRGGTLHGCLVRLDGAERMRILREPKAVAGLKTEPGALWDGRWRVEGPFQPGDAVRATGRALDDLPAWRQAGPPRESLMAAPSVWRAGALFSAPLAGHGRGFSVHLALGRDEFVIGQAAH